MRLTRSLIRTAWAPRPRFKEARGGRQQHTECSPTESKQTQTDRQTERKTDRTQIDTRGDGSYGRALARMIDTWIHKLWLPGLFLHL
jgi:hypothetical protein